MVDEILKEKSIWEKLIETKKPLILYGMGNGADRVISELELINVKVSGIMASDDFVRGQKFHDFTVKTLAQIEEEFKDFIILVTFGTERPEVINHIKELSQKYDVKVPSVPVSGTCIFNRSYLIQYSMEIKEAYELMADEMSRKTFRNMCFFQFTGELKYLFDMESSRDDAYRILNLTSEENYLDCGAYRGETIDEFLFYTAGKYKSITAIEPDKKSYKKLVDTKGDMENITLINKGIWNYDTQVNLITDRGRGSFMKSGKGELVDVTCINTLAETTRFSYINMDVEGVEFVALSGGYKLLSYCKPKLNIACYHRCCDIYRLPILIHRTNPDYKIYMRHHPYIPCWETNLYCV